MAQSSGEVAATQDAVTDLVTDWSAEKEVFRVHWGKAMMWIFLLSDTFIFTSFLVSLYEGADQFYRALAEFERNLRTEFWRRTDSTDSHCHHDLCANHEQRHHGTGRKLRLPAGTVPRQAIFLLITAAFGLLFVGMQAFEWTKLIGRRGGFDRGATHSVLPQFGASFFMITGFHGGHVSGGVIYLTYVAIGVLNGRYEEKRV